MKKAMIILLCIISTLTSLAFGFYEKTHDNEYLDNIEFNDGATYFYVKDSQIPTKEEITEFTRLSQKYQATFIRTDKLFKDNQEINFKSGIYSDNYFKNSPLKLASGRMPQSENEFLATYLTGKQNQSGVLHDLFKDYRLIFGSLNTFYQENESSVSGTYTLIVDSKNKNEVLYQLSEFFGITQTELLTPSSGKAYGEGTIFLLAIVFAVMIFAIFCLMNVFYPISCIKEIGVLKLQGFKYIDIWKQLNKGVITIPVVFILLSMLIQKIIIKGIHLEYFVKLIIIQSGILGICLLFSLLMLVFIRKFSISSMLKNFFNFRLSLYFSYFLKFLVFVGLIFTIPLMSKELTTLSNELNVKHVYEQEQHYLTLSNFKYVDNELQDFLNGEDTLGVKLTSLYKELEKTADIQYVATSRIHPASLTNSYTGKWEKIKFNPDESYVIMQANQNYLEKLNLELPVSSSKVFSKDQLTFLVPTSLKSQKDKIEFLVRDQAHSFFADDDNDPKLDDLPISIVYYPDSNKKIFSENIDMIDVDNGFVKNPIILCLSDYFYSEKNSYLQNSALSNPIRLVNSKENQQAIQNAIANNKLDRNSVQFGSVLSTGFAQELKISQTSVIAWLSIIGVAILVSVLASYYIILIILTSKKKEMLVSRILGYSVFDRYHNEIYYFFTIYCFGLIEILILSRQFIPLISYIILVLIDSAIIYMMVKVRENNSLSLALKGEE